MAIVCTESIESRAYSTGDKASATTVWKITGTVLATEARSQLATDAPTTFAGLVRRSIAVDPVFIDTSDGDATHNVWEGKVTYGLKLSKPETGESEYLFDTGGGTKHIEISRSTVASYALGGGAAEDMGQAIRVTGKGKEQRVEGVDIIVPVFNWQETHYLDDVYVTDAYKYALADLSGSVNREQSPAVNRCPRPWPSMSSRYTRGRTSRVLA